MTCKAYAKFKGLFFSDWSMDTVTESEKDYGHSDALTLPKKLS